MAGNPESILSSVAQLAADLGPALMPAVHEELLRSITAAAVALFEAEACSLALLDEERQELVFWATSGGRAQAVDGMRVPVGHGIAGWVVASGEAAAVEDVAADPRFASDVAARLEHTPGSIVAMPLQTDRGVLGVIEVLDPASDAMHRLDLLGLFAQQAALAIESSRVFSSLGRLLFEAAARAAGGQDMAGALAQAAASAPASDPDLAPIAAMFLELRRAGLEESALAARILQEFLAHARTRGWRA